MWLYTAAALVLAGVALVLVALPAIARAEQGLAGRDDAAPPGPEPAERRAASA